MQENGSDFTLSKPTEGVKLSGAAAGGATVNGSTLWRHLDMIRGRRCNICDAYESLRQQDREEYLTFYLKVSDAVLHLFQEF